MDRTSKYYPLHFGIKAYFRPVVTGLLLAIFFGAFIPLSARTHTKITGKVISVIDGNTIEIYTPEKIKLRVLLDGIDCPEIGQEYGHDAKAFLEKMVLDKEVVLEIKGKDRYGNHIAIVLVGDEVDLRVELLKEGLAWTSENGSSKDLDPYRTWAQRKGRGLWKQENPVPPWTYRRQQAMAEPKIR